MLLPELTGPAVLVAVLMAVLVPLKPAPLVGIDPQTETMLNPTEAAAERLLLNEALGLIRDKKYAFAVARLTPLTASRFLPDEVARAIPKLIEELRRLDAVTQLAATPIKASEKLPGVSVELLPKSIQRPLLWSELLQAIEILMETSPENRAKLPWTLPLANKLLNAAAEEFGPDAAGKLRVELSAKLFLAGRSKDANELLEGETPNDHAREVLADLRTIILGGGTLVNPQVARFVPARGLKEMPGVAPLVPTDLLEKWQPPKPSAETETTLDKLAARVRKELIAESRTEADRLSKHVTAAAERICAELAKRAGPNLPSPEPVRR